MSDIEIEIEIEKTGDILTPCSTRMVAVVVWSSGQDRHHRMMPVLAIVHWRETQEGHWHDKYDYLVAGSTGPWVLDRDIQSDLEHMEMISEVYYTPWPAHEDEERLAKQIEALREMSLSLQERFVSYKEKAK